MLPAGHRAEPGPPQRPRPSAEPPPGPAGLERSPTSPAAKRGIRAGRWGALRVVGLGANAPAAEGARRVCAGSAFFDAKRRAACALSATVQVRPAGRLLHRGSKRFLFFDGRSPIVLLYPPPVTQVQAAFPE